MSKNKRPKIRSVRIFDLFVSTASENEDIYKTLGINPNPTIEEQERVYKLIKEKAFPNKIVLQDTVRLKELIVRASRKNRNADEADGIKVINRILYLRTVSRTADADEELQALEIEDEELRDLIEKEKSRARNPTEEDKLQAYLSIKNGEFDSGLVGNRAIYVETVLHDAIKNFNTEIVKYCVENEVADINAVNSSGETALHIAARTNQTEIIELLLENGAKINTKVLLGDIRVSYLSQTGIDINSITNHYYNKFVSPYHFSDNVLHLAARYNCIDSAKILIEKDADIDAKNGSGNTPLHEAAAKGHFEIAKILIEKGANLNAKNLDEETPLDIAKKKYNDAFFDIFTTYQILNNNLLRIYKNDLDKVREIDNLVKEIAEQQDNTANIDKLTKYEELNEKLLKIYTNDPDKVEQINNLVKEIAKQQDNAANIDIFTKYQELSKKLAAIYNKNKDSDIIKEIKTLAENALDNSGIPLKVLINMPIDAKGNTILHEAAMANRITMVRELIANGANINAKNDSGNTPLHKAARLNRITMVLELIKELNEKGADIEPKNNSGNTPLHLAIIEGNEAIVTVLIGILIANRSNIDAKDNSWNTPLHLAAILNRITIVRELIESGAKIDAENISGYTPLHLAAMLNRITIVKKLIAKGVSIDAKDNSGYTPLHLAIIEGNETIFKELIAKGASIDTQDKSGNTPLHLAARFNRITIVKELIEKLNEKGAGIDTKNNSGHTPLHLATIEGNETIFKELIANGASIDTQDKSGSTPLHEATRIGNETIVKKLIKKLIAKGASIDTQDKSGSTPLHEAARYNRITIVKELIANGANVNSIDSDSRTPLHLAIIEGNETIFKELIAKGASIDTQDKSGSTPLHEAARYNRITIVKELIKKLNEKGAVIEPKNNSENTPLHEAAIEGNETIVKELIANGADIDATNDLGNTPLHSAAMLNRITIVEELIKKLIEKGSGVDTKNKSWHTPLHLATIEGNITIFKELIANGADINTKNDLGNTPLHSVARIGHSAIATMVIELIANGADINAKNLDGKTALEVASDGNGTNFPIISYIFEKYQKLNEELAIIYKENKDSDNIDKIKDLAETALGEESGIPLKMLINMPIDANGNTILHLALIDGNVKIAKLLIDEGADVKKYSFAADGSKTTSIHLALQYGCSALLPKLIEKGAIVNDTDSDKRTPLQTAAKAGDVEAIKLLLYYDADVNAEDKFGKTAYDTAKKNNQEAVKELLADFGANTPILDRIIAYITPKKSPYKTSTESRNIDSDPLNLEGEAKKPTPPQSFRDRVNARIFKKSPSKTPLSLSISPSKALRPAIGELGPLDLGDRGKNEPTVRVSVISPRPSSEPPLNASITSKDRVGLTILEASRSPSQSSYDSPSDSPSNSPTSNNVIELASLGISDSIEKIIDDYTSKEENIANQKNDENSKNRETIIKAFEKSLEGQKTKQIPDKAYRGIGAASALVDLTVKEAEELAQSGKDGVKSKTIRAIRIDKIFAPEELRRFYTTNSGSEKNYLEKPQSLEGQHIIEVQVKGKWLTIEDIIGIGEKEDLSKLAKIFHTRGDVAFKTLDQNGSKGSEQTISCERNNKTVFVTNHCQEAVNKDSELKTLVGKKFQAKTHGLECLDGFNNDKEIKTLKTKSAIISRG